MEWSAIFQLIDPSLLIVVAACWALGFILKQTPFVPNWSIIYLVTAFSISFAIWDKGFRPESILQGILCGAFAIYGHQLIKQARQAREEDEKS
jgi:hypothetical protein